MERDNPVLAPAIERAIEKYARFAIEDMEDIANLEPERTEKAIVEWAIRTCVQIALRVERGIADGR